MARAVTAVDDQEPLAGDVAPFAAEHVGSVVVAAIDL
jgi:hypothetical protein